MAKMLDEVCRGVPLNQIAGLSFANGLIVHNPNRSLGQVRDDLYPDREARRQDYVVTIKGARAGIAVDSIATSRGCPNHCAFCSFNRNPWGEMRRWSARSPESVVDELGRIQARLIGFVDDLFTHDLERVERICDLILARGIRKRYFVNARLEIARRPDVLRKMEQAGFSMLMLGVESAHDKTLRSMRKGFDVARIRKYFEVLRHSRMFLHGYFIVGCVGESREDMLRIAPFARELGLDTIALSVLRSSPYSGLDELVASSPGYHIAPNGKIYPTSARSKSSVPAPPDIPPVLHAGADCPRHSEGIAKRRFKLPSGFLPHLPQVSVARSATPGRKAVTAGGSASAALPSLLSSRRSAGRRPSGFDRPTDPREKSPIATISTCSILCRLAKASRTSSADPGYSGAECAALMNPLGT